MAYKIVLHYYGHDVLHHCQYQVTRALLYHKFLFLKSALDPLITLYESIIMDIRLFQEISLSPKHLQRLE